MFRGPEAWTLRPYAELTMVGSTVSTCLSHWLRGHFLLAGAFVHVYTAEMEDWLGCRGREDKDVKS
jgi:hypothetical protein